MKTYNWTFRNQVVAYDIPPVAGIIIFVNVKWYFRVRSEVSQMSLNDPFGMIWIGFKYVYVQHVFVVLENQIISNEKYTAW